MWNLKWDFFHLEARVDPPILMFVWYFDIEDSVGAV